MSILRHNPVLDPSLQELNEALQHPSPAFRTVVANALDRSLRQKLGTRARIIFDATCIPTDEDRERIRQAIREALNAGAGFRQRAADHN